MKEPEVFLHSTSILYVCGPCFTIFLFNDLKKLPQIIHGIMRICGFQHFWRDDTVGNRHRGCSCRVSTKDVIGGISHHDGVFRIDAPGKFAGFP